MTVCLEFSKGRKNSFKTDFSNIKFIKNDETATQIKALAYTQGNDVHFAPGQYNPGSQKGQELLGHELSHVVQQREGRVKPTNKQQSSYAKASEVNEGMPVNNEPALEKEADEQGRYAAQGKPVRVSNTAQQEKVQMKRDLPPANVIELEIDKSKVIDSFSELWENRPEKI
jgi:hypothetical protein